MHSVSKNESHIRLVTKKIKNFNAVYQVVNYEQVVWTPPGQEVYGLLAVFAKCRSCNGTITTPPEALLEVNNVTIVTAGVLPVVTGDIRQLATLQTNIAAQISAAHPLILKLSTDVTLNSATELLYDFVFVAVKFEDFGF